MKLICVFNKFLTGFNFFPHRVLCQSFLRCNDCFNMQRLALKWECPAFKQVVDSILLADGNSDRMIQHHHQQPNHQYWFSAVNLVHARIKSPSSLNISGRAPHSTPSTSTWTVSKFFCVHSKVLSRSACRLYPEFWYYQLVVSLIPGESMSLERNWYFKTYNFLSIRCWQPILTAVMNRRPAATEENF